MVQPSLSPTITSSFCIPSPVSPRVIHPTASLRARTSWWRQTGGWGGVQHQQHYRPQAAGPLFPPQTGRLFLCFLNVSTCLPIFTGYLTDERLGAAPAEVGNTSYHRKRFLNGLQFHRWHLAISLIWRNICISGRRNGIITIGRPKARITPGQNDEVIDWRGLNDQIRYRMRQERLSSAGRRPRVGAKQRQQVSGGVGNIISNVLKKRNGISRSAPRLLCTLEPGDPASCSDGADTDRSAKAEEVSRFENVLNRWLKRAKEYKHGCFVREYFCSL